MARRARYLLDADVLVQAHRRHYKFEIAPGFWDCLIWHYKQHAVCSIDKIRKEILDGKDALSQWVKRDCPASFFESTGAPAVGKRYGEIVQWAYAQKRYKPEALSKFATVADGWLVAYAAELSLTVVTQEVSAPESKSGVKVPDVCDAFKVPCIDTFDLLEKLGVILTWKS